MNAVGFHYVCESKSRVASPYLERNQLLVQYLAKFRSRLLHNKGRAASKTRTDHDEKDQSKITCRHFDSSGHSKNAYHVTMLMQQEKAGKFKSNGYCVRNQMNTTLPKAISYSMSETTFWRIFFAHAAHP